MGFPLASYFCSRTKNELIGTPGWRTSIKLPTPPEMLPRRIFDTLLFGLMLTNSFVLWLAVNEAVQESPLGRRSISRAFRLSSKPWFFMLPMLVVTKFERLHWAHTGTVKIRSLVFFVYQSKVPLYRWLLKPKSTPALYELVFSQWIAVSTALGRI